MNIEDLLKLIDYYYDSEEFVDDEDIEDLKKIVKNILRKLEGKEYEIDN